MDEKLPAGDGDNENESRNTPKHNYNGPNVELDAAKRFACPYFKRSPRKYQKVRSCPGPGWITVHRLKLVM
ncbi:hypothetical protein AOQ84DRAFT_66745 [Glonium stellatum]|uniref:Uncharacterized protein n=1 Tax=Glonium stellatum TaxID=574774 RepID=A0A8E2FBC3_9PEZI|nr:hypothetical protein AOQ84DRAFT_66745 [Glonium stellatum]